MRIAKEIGATPAQVALSWVTNQPTVVSPIVGARTVKHLIENLGAADLRVRGLRRRGRAQPGQLA